MEGTLGLLPYAALDVLRNRRRAISSILGVLLAVTFVAGTFIAIDSSARATLDASLAGIQGDFSFTMNIGGSQPVNYSTIEQAVLEVQGVVNASIYRSLPPLSFELHDSSNNVTYTYSAYQAWGIDPDHPPVMIRDSKVTGALTLPRGSVGVSKDLATFLKVGLGDSVRVVNRQNETLRWGANLTVRAVIEQSFPPGYVGGVPYYYYGGSIAVIHIRDSDWLLSQLNQSVYGRTFSGEVWIDRTLYVNPYDPDATARNLERIQRRLQAVLGTEAYSVQDNILPRIQEFSNRVAGQRIQFFVLSGPVVLLGVYLGAVGVDLGHAERRRELAILKTRGARRSQLFGLLLAEAVIGGLVAALIGLAAGVVVSRVLIGIVSPPSGSSASYDAFRLTTDTIFAVALLSILLMAGVAYRSAKRTAGLSIIETLRYYSPGETKIQYSPKADIVLVSIGLVDYALVWWRSGGGPMNIWAFLLGVIPFLLLPFVPLMLIIGSTRLLTRGTGKVYDWFSHAAKPLVGELYHVVRRNLVRNPRRSSNIAIIIALGLAFGTFTLSTLATSDAHTAREIRAGVGADMAVYSRNSSVNLAPNLTAVPGVAGVALIRGISGVSATFCCPSVYGIEPNSYFAVTQPESWYFVDGSPEKARDILSTRGQALISQTYFTRAFLEIGDRITLSANGVDRNNTPRFVQVNVTVGGVVRSLPGAGLGYDSFVFANLDTVAPLQIASYSSSDSYLVDLAPGASWRSVRDAITNDPNVSFVRVAEEQIESIASNPFTRALYQFISMELVFIGIILTAGIGLILYAASLERDVEFAAIIARGSSGWQTAKLLVGEAFVIMLVGLAIGVSVGVGTAFFATQFIASGPAGSFTPLVPYYFVFPLEALLLVVLGPAAMLLSAVLVSARTARMNVAQVLKLRGG